MKEQLSQFVQTMHALPWRELRENIDQNQLEELFKVLSNVPQTLDQVRDVVFRSQRRMRRAEQQAQHHDLVILGTRDHARLVLILIVVTVEECRADAV